MEKRKGKPRRYSSMGSNCIPHNGCIFMGIKKCKYVNTK